MDAPSVVEQPSLGLEARSAAALQTHLAQFGEMLVRDYLAKRGLARTLREMDREAADLGQAPPTMEGWTAVAGLVGLADLLRANEASGGAGAPILEVLTKELVRETSVKMRRPVTLTVLHGAPSCAERTSVTSLARTLTRTPGGDAAALPPPSAKRRERKKPPVPPAPSLTPAELAGRPTTLVCHSLSKFDAKKPVGVRVAPGARKAAAHATARLSVERWIPMDCRERRLQRDLAVTKKNVMLVAARRDFVAADARHHQLSELEQNAVEERYGLKKKKRCGLCHMEYSVVNLVLQVPQKAIDDLRSTWAERSEPHKAHVKACARTHKAFTYDRVGVCVLCSQFFQLGQQEHYRPSYEAKVQQKTITQRKLEAELEKRFWDPVKQLEADRVDKKLGSGPEVQAIEGVAVPPAPLAVDV